MLFENIVLVILGIIFAIDTFFLIYPFIGSEYECAGMLFVLDIILVFLILLVFSVKHDNISYWNDVKSRQASLNTYLTEIEILNNDTSNDINEKSEIMLKVMDEYNSLLENTINSIEYYHCDTTPYNIYSKLYYDYSTNTVKPIPPNT